MTTNVQLLLVGGATRMPAVRNSVRNMTGLEPRPELVDPDAAVALGAAIYAGVLSGKITDLLTLDNWKAALLRALVGHDFEDDASLKAKFIPEHDAVPAVGGELDASWEAGKLENVSDDDWHEEIFSSGEWRPSDEETGEEGILACLSQSYLDEQQLRS
jgi:molecular chaperone DnaK (HSP70)